MEIAKHACVRRRALGALLLVLALASLTYGCLAPPVQDYRAYMLHWQATLDGKDPWLGTLDLPEGPNTYGPLFNLFALAFAIHPGFPRILWILFWYLMIFMVLGSAASSIGAGGRRALWTLLFLALQPFVWIRVVHFSQADVFIAFLIAASVLAKRQGRSGLAGILVGLAVGMKIYPIVCLPFLATERRRLDWRLLLAATVIIVGSFAASYLAYGGTFVLAFENAGDRSSKHLSIFAFLRGFSILFPSVAGRIDLDAWSVPMLALGGFITFALHWRYRLDALSGSLIALTVTLLLFKVGHQQFHLALIALLGVYLHTSQEKPAYVWWSLASYLLVLNVYDIGYVATGYYLGEWFWVRAVGGLPAFLVMLWLYAALVREAALAADVQVGARPAASTNEASSP